MIRDRQHGITKDKSCLTKLMAFYNEVTASVEKGRALDVIYLDLCKISYIVSYNNLPVNGKYTGLMDGLLDKELVGVPHLKSYSQWLNVQGETSKKWCTSVVYTGTNTI